MADLLAAFTLRIVRSLCAAPLVYPRYAIRYAAAGTCAYTRGCPDEWYGVARQARGTEEGVWVTGCWEGRSALCGCKVSFF